LLSLEIVRYPIDDADPSITRRFINLVQMLRIREHHRSAGNYELQLHEALL
jgi:hypothetical protein